MDAETLLQRSGWFPGRRIQVDGEVAFIRSEGFPVTPAAERFLEEYSDLTIVWETRRNPLVLSGSEAARGVDSGWCEAYSEAIGLVLSPVGVYSHMTLYVDPAGGLWGGYDREYGQVGSLLDVVRETFLQPARPFDRLLDAD